MAAMGLRNLQLLARTTLNTGGRRNIHVHQEGIPGATLPFKIGQNSNPVKLMLYMTLYVGSGFTTPFIMVRHQLKKKSGA